MSDIPAIHRAAGEGDLETIRQSLGRYPTLVSRREPNLGQTPLHIVAASGQREAAILLLDSGADVNAKNDNAETPLHWAALEGHKDVAVLLLTKRASVDAQDKYGVTPLHMAANRGHELLVETLLDSGADVFATSEFGNALQLAKSKGHDDVADLLRRRIGRKLLLRKQESKPWWKFWA